MKEKDKNNFKTRRIISFILSLVLLIGMIPVFPKAEGNIPVMDLDPNDIKTYSHKSNPDEVAIEIKREVGNKYVGKRIKIPATINGKKIISIGAYEQEFKGVQFYGFFPRQPHFNGWKYYFPDISEAKHLKYIGTSACSELLLDKEIVLEGIQNLSGIGNKAFEDNKFTKIVLKDLPNLSFIGERAFRISKDSYNSNLPICSIEISNVPKLEMLNTSVFSGINIPTVVDLRNTNISKIGYGVFGPKIHGSILIKPNQIRKIEDAQIYNTNEFIDYGYHHYKQRHKIYFKFVSKDSQIQLPTGIKEIVPKDYDVYPILKMEDTYDLLYTGDSFDAAKMEKFDKYTNPENGDEWKFLGWSTTDKYAKAIYAENEYILNQFRPVEVRYTGTWILLLNKTELKKALEAANTKKENVVVSADGADLPFTKLWVTQQDRDTFDGAITTAQGIFDSDSIPGNTKEERQQYIDNATEALKQATEKYNPQEGKLTYDKNPNYAKPQGAHLVTFEAGTGVEPLTSTDKFYVKDNTALPADRFPQATAQAGFGTKIFWNPAQETLITADQPFTASAKAVDKDALQEKITEAERLIQNDSTSDPAVALNTKVNEAKALITAIENGTERNQDNVDAKVTELESAIQALKDLNTKKDAAKTQIGDIDGLKPDEITTLQGEVDAAKNTDAVDAIIAKAQAQAQTNKAVDEAEKAVKDLEDKKGKVTDEEIAAAKEKVEKVTDPTKKKDLQDRLDKVKEDKKKVDDEKAAEAYYLRLDELIKIVVE